LRRDEAPVREQAVIADADGEGCGEIETEEEREVNGARGEPQAEQPAGVQAEHEKALNPLNARQHGERLFECESVSSFFEQKIFPFEYLIRLTLLLYTNMNRRG
jgi:hypothetical protein